MSNSVMKIYSRDLFVTFTNLNLINDAMGNGATRNLTAIQTHFDKVRSL